MGGQCHAPAALPPVRARYPLHRRLGVSQGRSGQVFKCCVWLNSSISACRLRNNIFEPPFAGNECFLNSHQICFILQTYINAIATSLFISVYFPSLCLHTIYFSYLLLDSFLCKSSRTHFYLILSFHFSLDRFHLIHFFC